VTAGAAGTVKIRGTLRQAYWLFNGDGAQRLTGLTAPLNSEQYDMGNSHRRPKPKWYDRATRAEIEEIEAIDKLMATLRARRERLINRTGMRTQVWAERRRHHRVVSSDSVH